MTPTVLPVQRSDSLLACTRGASIPSTTSIAMLFAPVLIAAAAFTSPPVYLRLHTDDGRLHTDAHRRMRSRPTRLDAELDPGFDRDSLDVLLLELEGLRDWVSDDVATAALAAAREKRDLDAFISELQDEVAAVGAQVKGDFELVEQFLEEQAEAMAAEKRDALAERARVLLDELEAAAPASFKSRNVSTVPPLKSSFLPRGASIIVAGVASPFGAALVEGLASCGYNATVCSLSVPPGCADPTLPASGSLRRTLSKCDGLVLVCSGAVDGGVSPTFVAAAARVLPPTLRRVLLLAPRGVDRTFEPAYALRNVLSGLGLDRQRAAEQAICSAASAVGAVSSVMRFEVSGPELPWEVAARASLPSEAPSRAPRGIQIAPGDVLEGAVPPSLATRAVREALRRPEAEDCRFSLGAGCSGDWADEFLKLLGPEIARLRTPSHVTREEMVAWVRGWARELSSATGDDKEPLLRSSFTVLDLPTRAAAAAAKRLELVDALPTGARIRFLASGAEYVDDDGDERTKGDFDGALDLLVEKDRVRIVRAEMEPVWRRSKTEGRKQFTPLVKVESEKRLLRRMAKDLDCLNT